MGQNPNILVVDDERAIAELVAELLLREGMECQVCTSGPEALDVFAAGRFDLVILDVMMPGMDGLEVCTRLRQRSECPIIFLSARDEEADKVIGLTLGGDDYVVKPFRPRELVARVRARLRRAQLGPVRPGVVEAKGIEVDPTAHMASLHGVALSLTPKEFGMLQQLVAHAPTPVPTRELYELVWGEPFDASCANSVMVHIRNLRKKLAAIDESEPYIETAWGVGYKIVPIAAGGMR